MATIEETVQTEQEAYENELAARADELEDEAEREIELQPGETEVALDEQDATDEPAEPITEPTGQTALLDKEHYQREDLAIAKVDGSAIDRIAIKFTGQVFLDRSDPNDVRLYNKLRLGGDITLMVEAKCSSTGAKGATDREGDLDVVIGEKGAKIHTVYIPAGELDDEAA